jgi:hypothetical protein
VEGQLQVLFQQLHGSSGKHSYHLALLLRWPLLLLIGGSLGALSHVTLLLVVVLVLLVVLLLLLVVMLLLILLLLLQLLLLLCSFLLLLLLVTLHMYSLPFAEGIAVGACTAAYISCCGPGT